MKNNRKGFTLIEIMLVIGLISLAVIAIYTVYNKKRTETLVKNQAIYLQQISNGLNASFSSTTDFSLLTNANVIASRVVPNPMVESSTIVRNLWGGDVNFSGTLGSPSVFSILLNGIPTDACSLLATTDFSNNAREVIINGTSVKGVDAVATSASTSGAVTACQDGTNNILEFRNPVVHYAQITAVDPSSHRNRENPYYIPSVATPVNSPGVSCAGGSSWTGSFCSCPVNSEWDGNTCVGYGSKPGACPMGQGWNGNACVTHAIIPSPGGTYMGGRTLPNVGYVAPQVEQTIASAVCNTASVTPGNFDTKACQTCANGTWNGFRCVMP